MTERDGKGEEDVYFDVVEKVLVVVKLRMKKIRIQMMRIRGMTSRNMGKKGRMRHRTWRKTKRRIIRMCRSTGSMTWEK